MTNKKKITISISVLVLLLLIGVSYAAFVYNDSGYENNQLVLGDIYMHYNETNQIMLEQDNMKTISIPDYTYYEINSVMKLEETGTGVLGKCEEYFNNLDMTFDEGSTVTTFCKGTGTIFNGFTFQELYTAGFVLEQLFSQEEIDRFLFDRIIQPKVIPAKEITYTKLVRNPYMEGEVLARCESIFEVMMVSEGVTFDEGTTVTTYCQGTGTFDGLTLQDAIDTLDADNEFLKRLIAFNIVQPINENYFEFTIDGKNTYKNKDIWYEIVLTHGDNHNVRTTRIRDDLLRFNLVEIIDGEEIPLTASKTYDDLTNKRIWVDTIEKNTTSEIERTYRLYMEFSPYIRVGLVGPNSNATVDYDFDTWNNEVYASIKVKVNGDFNEKGLVLDDIATNSDCFETKFVSFKVNNNMTEEELLACENIITDWGYDFDEGSSAVSFCKGEGTSDGGITFQESIDAGIYWALEEAGNIAYFLENGGQDLLDNNIIIGNLEITDYDKTCGPVVVIPSQIDGYSVNTIGRKAFYDKELTTVKFSEGLESIVFESFLLNKIKNVTIPNSVKNYNCDSFDNFVIINKNEDLICKDFMTNASCFTTQLAFKEEANAVNSDNWPYSINENITDEQLNKCAFYFNDVLGWDLDEGEDFESFCEGTGTISGLTFEDYYNDGEFSDEDIDYFLENYILISDDASIAITGYDVNCGGRDIVIPEIINGYQVTIIADGCSFEPTSNFNENNSLNNLLYKNFDNKSVDKLVPIGTACYDSFVGKGLTSVVIPDTVEYIGANAFMGNNLKSLTFGKNSNLHYISEGAFKYNNLEEITLPNNLWKIDGGAFRYNKIIKVDMPDSVYFYACSAFDEEVQINSNNSCSATEA